MHLQWYAVNLFKVCQTSGSSMIEFHLERLIIMVNSTITNCLNVKLTIYLKSTRPEERTSILAVKVIDQKSRSSLICSNDYAELCHMQLQNPFD